MNKVTWTSAPAPKTATHNDTKPEPVMARPQSTVMAARVHDSEPHQRQSVGATSVPSSPTKLTPPAKMLRRASDTAIRPEAQLLQQWRQQGAMLLPKPILLHPGKTVPHERRSVHWDLQRNVVGLAPTPPTSTECMDSDRGSDRNSSVVDDSMSPMTAAAYDAADQVSELA